MTRRGVLERSQWAVVGDYEFRNFGVSRFRSVAGCNLQDLDFAQPWVSGTAWLSMSLLLLG